MSTNPLPTSVTLPPGRYVVGDPCYVFEDHERWMRWLEASRYEESPDILIGEIDGHVVVGVSTAYGDGLYHDTLGNEFPVDAGLIGLVPVEIADLGRYPTSEIFLEVTEPLLVEAAEDGVIVLGPHAILTGDEEEDEEECFNCGGSIEYGCGCDDEDDEDDEDED